MGNKLYRQLWAKSSVNGVGHSLLGHLIDVGLVAEKLLVSARYRPIVDAFCTYAGWSSKQASGALALLIGAHDVGKASPAFQQKWPPGVPEQLREERFFGKYPDVFHGEATAVYLYDWLAEKGWKKRFRAMVANAVGVHHGHLLRNGFWSEDRYDHRALAREMPPWHDMRERLLADLEAVFGNVPEYLGPRSAPPAKLWVQLAGITTIADWLGSGLEHRVVGDDLSDYLAARRNDIDAHLKNVGWQQRNNWWVTPPEPASFRSWFSSFGSDFVPRPLQVATEQAAQINHGEPALIVVEAPMGEGKTEAAFYLLTQDNHSSGAYIALPTQATSDALFDRLKSYVADHAQEPMYVALAHSSANLVRGIRSSDTHAEGIDADTDRIRWFAGGQKDLLAQLGVGTIDQALIGVIPVRHHFVRLMGLANKVIVLDEVHAYDTYTSGLIEKFVRWMATLGSTVVLMSATLPNQTRHRLLNAYAEGLGIAAPETSTPPYPRLMKLTTHGVHSVAFTVTPERRQTMELRAAPYNCIQLAEFLLELPRAGAIGVVVNTVQRAQDLYQLIRESRSDVHLVHARLPLAIRKHREQEILSQFGRSSTGLRTGVVIATQVIEQSLDIDFDVLISDLAPADLLLQRAGRLHRHARAQRGNFSRARVYIAGFHAQGGSGPDRDALGFVYDEYILWRTWGSLQAQQHLVLPDEIDSLVQMVYSDHELPILAQFSEEIRLARRESVATDALHSHLHQHNAIVNPDQEASEAWQVFGVDAEDARKGFVKIQTRLGADSVNAVPVVVSANTWRVYGTSETISRNSLAPHSWMLAAAEAQIRFNRASYVHTLLSQQRPKWWERSTLLRHLFVLELREDGSALHLPNVVLDAELGLVYPRVQKPSERIPG